MKADAELERKQKNILNRGKEMRTTEAQKATKASNFHLEMSEFTNILCLVTFPREQFHRFHFSLFQFFLFLTE